MIATIERALELAKSGNFRSVDEIRTKLKKEGSDGVEAHVTGSLAKQLKVLMKQARDQNQT